MRRVITILLGLLVAGQVCSACGGDDGNDDDLTIYAGDFSVVETFRDQNGSLCPSPTQPYENEVRILIKKSQFEARFATKWGTLYGEIHEDGSFLATDPEPRPDEDLAVTGQYVDENGFGGLVKEVWQGCTRWTNLLGDRIVQDE